MTSADVVHEHLGHPSLGTTRLELDHPDPTSLDSAAFDHSHGSAKTIW